MKAPDLTVVKASECFWNEFFSKSLQIKNYNEILKINDDEIVISSDECKDVLEEILRLSKEYMNFEFRVKTDNGDTWNNYVKLYKCKNGFSKIIFEGYEYCFCVTDRGEKKYDVNELEVFKKKLAEFYRKIDIPDPKNINIEIPLDLSKYEERANIEDLSYEVTYVTKSRRFVAKRSGLTYVSIDISLLRPWIEDPEN